MPTRKMSERERLTRWAREASSDALDEAIEILTIEKRVRSGSPNKKGQGSTKKPATTKRSTQLDKELETAKDNSAEPVN